MGSTVRRVLALGSLVCAACSVEPGADAGGEDGGLPDHEVLGSDDGGVEGWSLPAKSPVALSPRTQDGILAGTYTATPPYGTVTFWVRATGPESAEAHYLTGDFDVKVTLTDAAHATMTAVPYEEIVVDGRGPVDQLESTAMFVLMLPPMFHAIRGVPLELGCSPGFTAAELGALTFPWQLLLKYGAQDREAAIAEAAAEASCAYFVGGDDLPSAKPERRGDLRLDHGVGIPVVAGIFPFDEAGAVEVSALRAAASSGPVCNHASSAHDSSKGPCGETCLGVCTRGCSPTNCERHPDGKECCTTVIGNPEPYSVRIVSYVCEVDEDCRELDNCYQNCNSSKGCGSWAAFGCRHDITSPDSCDSKCVAKYGKKTCVAGMLGHPLTKKKVSYQYTEPPEYEPPCAPSGCVPRGTLVTLAGGARVPIEEMKIGDAIAAIDPGAGTAGVALTEAVLVHPGGPFALDRLVLSSGDELELTPNHPVWTMERGYVAAGELLSGEHLLRLDAASGVAVEVTLVAVLPAASEATVVYNLKTTASSYVAAGVLVHNK